MALPLALSLPYLALAVAIVGTLLSLLAIALVLSQRTDHAQRPARRSSDLDPDSLQRSLDRWHGTKRMSDTEPEPLPRTTDPITDTLRNALGDSECLTQAERLTDFIAYNAAHIHEQSSADAKLNPER